MPSTSLESDNRVSDYLKAIGHIKRYQILTLLVEKPQKSSYLLEKLKIEKTALAYHLSFLKDAFLLEKIQHGVYGITRDGEDLVNAISDVFERSQLRKFQQQQLRFSQYSRSYQQVIKTKWKLISPEPVFEDHWHSFFGAILGVLKSKGIKTDLITIGGYSGYAFVINVAKGRLCASGPSSLSLKVWGEIREGTEHISGTKLKVIGDYLPYPSSTVPNRILDQSSLNETDQSRAKELFVRISAEIDQNRPVILWGIPIPEYGIVIGYEGKSYLCSTYRHTLNIPETPVPYDGLHAPIGLHAILFTGESEELPQNIDLEAVSRALRLVNPNSSEEGYVLGPNALIEWAEALEHTSLDDLSYHSNSYVGGCLSETTTIAAKFLRLLGDRYAGNPQGNLLLNASTEYKRMRDLAASFTTLFPFAMEGKIERGQRQKGAKILRAIFPHKNAAIDQLKQAIDVWDR